jgi:fucose permease
LREATVGVQNGLTMHEAPELLCPATARKVAPGRVEEIVFYLAFAVTGVFHVVGGAVLPALAAETGLNDSQSGLLFLCYFLGSSLGALVCIRRHATLMTLGFFSAAITAAAISCGNPRWLNAEFLWMGLSIGVPMSAISILAGLKYGRRSAAPLALLSFIWSCGALVGPLLAAHLLKHHGYRMVYGVFAAIALCIALACWRWGTEAKPAVVVSSNRQPTHLPWILFFMMFEFLVVGVENTSVTWLAVYAQRLLQVNAALAAVSSSLYWGGYLFSRALSSLLLVRLRSSFVLTGALVVSFSAAMALVTVSSAWTCQIALVMLGMGLAPIFPLVLASCFARVQNPADSRWVLACSGMGGAALPWLVGRISAHSGSLRIGFALVPLILLWMLCLMPVLFRKHSADSPEPQN